MRRAKFIAASLGLAALIGGGVAYAAIPDSDDAEFHVCMPTTGSLRTALFFDKQAGTTCPSGYTEKAWNQVGPQGPTGATGPQGATGPAGSVEITRVSDSFEVEHGTMETGDANCPAGTVVTGGGYAVGGSSIPGFDYKVEASYPGTVGNGAGNGWAVLLKNFETSADITVFVHAVCATAS